MAPTDPAALRDDPLLRRVWNALGRPRCHLTGGYLRDRLLGTTSADLDLSMAGEPEDAASPARSLAEHLGVRAHLLGAAPNQVWRIETPELKVELWPRGDLELDDDIERRDFSCNALMWELPDGPLVDRVGGLDDIEEGRLSAISRSNFEDDPVRLLRAPRFLAQLPGFALEPESAGWIRSLAPHLSSSPRERVGQELLKLLDAPGAERGLRVLIELGLFVPSAPAEADPDPGWLEVNLHSASRLSRAAPHPLPSAVREAGIAASLGLLLRAWGLPTSHIVSAYAWGNNQRRHATYAADHLGELTNAVDAAPGERSLVIHRAGTAFPAALALAAAVQPDRHGWRRWWRLWQRRGPELVAPEPLLSGPDVMDLLELAPGPELGAAFRAVTDAQIRGEVRSREGARRWLREWAERRGRTRAE
ncbi:MAG: CCA tRNA nucleotidyltransferase [Acidobacteria bacterium]|nr:CCA tRNA nucleotidyltransferase [Acidobacteriota bacterium]